MKTVSDSVSLLRPAAAFCALGFSLVALEASENYDAVIGRLDTGGQFLGYMDISQDPEKVVESFQAIFDAVKEIDPSVPPIPLDLKTVVGRLGIFSLDAFGASSVLEGDNEFLNKGYMYFPDGREGLFLMLGGEAHPLTIQNFAPVDSVLAVEFDLDLACVRDVALAIATDVMGPMGAGMVQNGLNQPLGPVAWTWNDVLDRADTRVSLVGSMDPTLPPMELDGGKLSVPAFDFVLGLDGFGDLFDLLTPMAMGTGMMTLESAEGYDYLQMVEERPPEMMHFRPVFVRMTETNQLLLASRHEYLQSCFGSGAKLVENERYKSLTKGFPQAGNSLSYVAPELVDIFSEAMMAGAVQENPQAASFMQAINEASFFKFTGGASVLVNEEGGVSMLSRENSSYKSKILAAPIAAAAIAASIAIPVARQFGGGQEEYYEEGVYEETWGEEEGYEDEGMYEEEGELEEAAETTSEESVVE